MSTFYYYKSPNILTNQGTHNSPHLWHSRVVRSSNLTFGGYSAGTTLVLSVGSSLFMLCKYCFKHVRTVWFTVDFLASLVGTVCGKALAAYKPYYRFPDKELHGTCLMATTNNVQGDKPRPTALERHIQTLTTAMERLTKLNQDLEEQLRQKNAAIGT